MQLEFGGQRVSIAAGELVIGSDPEASIVLAGLRVLPRHAVVRLAAGVHPVILPASGHAEVEVNGTRIGREPTPLMHGDRIRIAGHELTVADPMKAGQTQVLAPRSDPDARAELAPAGAGPRRSGPPGRLVSLTDGREYSLDTVPFVLGRDATAEVVIGSPDSSRRHAEIATRPDGDVLVDLSTNGTYVNGKRIEGRYPLKALDVIRIGAEEFRYYPPLAVLPRASLAPVGAEARLSDTLIGLPAVPKMVPARRPAGSDPTRPLADLLVRRGTAKGERLPIFRPTANIGRAEYNDVRLSDPSVSAAHAKLQLREGIWTLNDLGSTNGTSADGMVVTDDMPLSPGTVITIGEVDLLFEPHDEGITLESEIEAVPEVPARLAPIEPVPIPVAPLAVAPSAGSAPRTEAVRSFVPTPARSSRRTGTIVVLVGVIVLAAALAALLFLP